MKAVLQKELRSKNISEVCKKHNLTLKQLIDIICRKKEYGSRKRDLNNMFIYPNKTSFKIQKTINKKSVSFGSYSTIEDARKVRDKLIEFDWDKDYLPLICRQLGVERMKQGGGVKECM